MLQVFLRLALGALVCLGLGCRKQATEGSHDNTPAVPQLKAAAKKPAVLVGSVTLEPGRELPSYPPEQMERSVLAHVGAGTFPKECSPPRHDDRTPVRLTPDGKLIDVLLAASEFSARAEPGPVHVHTLEINDCRLSPRLVVARVGDVLHIANKTDFALMPGLPSESFSQTMQLGQSRDIPLDKAGQKNVMCGFSAPCGRADVVVMGHPFTAVTNDKGEFRIEGFPADETVRIHAWHPLFSESFKEVRVAAGEEKRIELVLSPLPPPVPLKPATAAATNPNDILPD
ncbi:MAG: hypothetical protein RL701_2353 [Pseudomonadota bacterium]